MSLLHSPSGLTFVSCVSASSSSSSFSSSSSGSSLLFTITLAPISSSSLKRTNLLPKPSLGRLIGPPIAGAFVVKVSSDTPDAEDTPSESDGEDFPAHDLPLDAKLQSKLEKKMKMKVAKKIRLRRKKLVRKRRLRKKGRWPPSKMKKLSNV